MLKCILLIFSCSSLAFGWEVVYLASFPRSGNHWVRFLIEGATHIATSSVYRDCEYPHLREKLPWGGYATDHGYEGNCHYPTEEEPVVLKTHYPCVQSPLLPTARGAICLIRHPIDAIYSFYVYREKKGRDKIPKRVLRELIRKWRDFYEFWDIQAGVLLIRYEDLHHDPAPHLAKILQAIGYQVRPEDIQRAVDRYPPSGELLKHICHYEEEDLALIRTRLSDLLMKYGYDL